MKAKLVLEYLDFERGIKPKRALGIGRFRDYSWEGSTVEHAEYMIRRDDEIQAMEDFEWTPTKKENPIYVDDFDFEEVGEDTGYIEFELSNGDKIEYDASPVRGQHGPACTVDININGQLFRHLGVDELDEVLGQYGTWTDDILAVYKNWYRQNKL